MIELLILLLTVVAAFLVAAIKAVKLWLRAVISLSLVLLGTIAFWTTAGRAIASPALDRFLAGLAGGTLWALLIIVLPVLTIISLLADRFFLGREIRRALRIATASTSIVCIYFLVIGLLPDSMTSRAMPIFVFFAMAGTSTVLWFYDSRLFQFGRLLMIALLAIISFSHGERFGAWLEGIGVGDKLTADGMRNENLTVPEEIPLETVDCNRWNWFGTDLRFRKPAKVAIYKYTVFNGRPRLFKGVGVDPITGNDLEIVDTVEEVQLLCDAAEKEREALKKEHEKQAAAEKQKKDEEAKLNEEQERRKEEARLEEEQKRLELAAAEKQKEEERSNERLKTLVQTKYNFRFELKECRPLGQWLKCRFTVSSIGYDSQLWCYSGSKTVGLGDPGYVWGSRIVDTDGRAIFANGVALGSDEFDGDRIQVRGITIGGRGRNSASSHLPADVPIAGALLFDWAPQDATNAALAILEITCSPSPENILGENAGAFDTVFRSIRVSQ